MIEKSGNNSFQSPGNVSQALALSKVPETRRKEVLAKAGKDAKDQDRKMTAKDIAKNELAIKKAEMARTKKQSPGGGRESSSDMSSEVNVFYNVSITSLSEVSAGIKHLLDVLKINVTTTSRKPESTLTCHPSTNEIEGVLGTLGHYLAEHHTTDFTVRITG